MFYFWEVVLILMNTFSLADAIYFGGCLRLKSSCIQVYMEFVK